MASSGTIDGTRSGYKPYLRINWNIDQTDIPGNRTRLRLRLYLMHPYNVQYSATKSGVLQGNSFKSTKNVSGTGNTLLRTQYVWVSHNSDGSKTQRLSASFNIAITYSGSWLGSLSVSGNAYLNSIPRGSTLSAFSFPSSFQPSTSNKINYTVKRHSSNYRHQLQLRDGSVTVAQWDNLNSSGSSSVTVSSSQANSILKRMSSTTSKSFTLRLATRRSSGGSWVGNIDTRTATASVHSSVKPTIISTSAVPIRNSWAADRGLYVQGQSGVSAEFKSSAEGGARVKSRNIAIGGNNGGSVVGDVFRHTHGVLTGTGNVTITYKITDTRGRSTSATRTINRLAYSPPKISTFEAVRGGTNNETITIRRIGTVNTLSGRNSANLKITETLGDGTSKTVQEINFTSNFDNTVTSTVSSSASATYDIVVTDDLGNRASASVTIGTAFMEFSIRRGKGVGIGKVHEFGVLDVDGPASFGWSNFDTKGKVPVIMQLQMGDDRTGLLQGKDPSGNTVWQIGNRMINNRTLYLESFDYTGIKMTAAKVRINDDEIVDSGVSGNGYWVRFYNGTQICHGRISHNFYTTISRYTDLPKPFMNSSYAVSLGAGGGEWREIETVSAVGVGVVSPSEIRFHRFNSSDHRKGDYGNKIYNYIAIGRWK